MKINRMTVDQAREALRKASKAQGGGVSKYTRELFHRIMELVNLKKIAEKPDEGSQNVKPVLRLTKRHNGASSRKRISRYKAKILVREVTGKGVESFS